MYWYTACLECVRQLIMLSCPVAVILSAMLTPAVATTAETDLAATPSSSPVELSDRAWAN